MDTSNLVKFTDTTIWDTILRFGLYIGAIFQLICLGACVFLPYNGCNDSSEDNEEKTKNTDQSLSVLNSATKRPFHRNRKQEKKKRR